MNILIPDSLLREYLQTKAEATTIAKEVALCGPSVERVEMVEGEPVYDVANDTANMNRAFGKTTWTPKAVWVLFSDGRIYMASTHNTPHGTSHIRNNDFNGHLCVHFPRTDAQVASIGSYATSHQKAIDLGWEATKNRALAGY